MDGVDGSISDGVLVFGATNRPSTLDSALIRPGRFDKVIYVPNPDEKGRQMILRSQCQKWGENAATDINVETLSSEKISGMMTGAEIVGACKEAAMLAIREHNLEEHSNIDNRALSVQQRHLEKTLGAVAPLLSDPSVLSEYTSFDKKYTS
jgi:transitional endoplasmic reticulum ATPase